MDFIKTRKWIKIIAAYTLIFSSLTTVYYVLVLSGNIEDNFSSSDHIIFIAETTAGIIIFIGLWKLTTWGWKFAVLYTLISWIYYPYDILADYERFMSTGISPVIFIEAYILRFLLSSDVRECLKVDASIFSHFNWVPTTLVLFASFLLVNDFFGGYIAIFTVIAILLCIRGSNKKKKMNLLRI